MAITLTGRVLDSSGSGLNGVSVTATPVGSGTPTSTVSTATVSTEAGVYTFSAIADGTYKIDATYNGQTRELWGNARVQFGSLTIGANIASIDTAGNIAGVSIALSRSNGHQGIQLISTTGTNAATTRFSNTGGDGYIGLDNSIGGVFGGAAYSMVVWSPASQNIELIPGATAGNRITFASNGAVTIRNGLTVSAGGASVTGVSGIGIAPSASSVLTLGAGTTALSSLRITAGVAPTSPVDGDVWYDGANVKIRVGGTTKTFTIT